MYKGNIALYVIPVYMCVCVCGCKYVYAYIMCLFVQLAPLSESKKQFQVQPGAMTCVSLAGTLSVSGVQEALKPGAEKSNSETFITAGDVLASSRFPQR